MKEVVDKKFNENMQEVFKEFLSPRVIKRVYVKNKKTNEILKDINYDRVFFDTNLNLFKIDDSGKLVPVFNDDFEVVVEEELFG